MKRFSTTIVTATVLATSIVAGSAAGTSGLAKSTFSKNVCALVPASALAAARVTGPCVQEKISPTNEFSAQYGAHWGSLTSGPPEHGLVVIVRRPRTAHVLAHYKAIVTAGLSSPGVRSMKNGYFIVDPKATKLSQGLAIFVADRLVCLVYLYDKPKSGPVPKAQIQTALLTIVKDISHRV